MNEYRYVLGLRPKTWAWFAPLLIVILLGIWASWTLLELVTEMFFRLI